MLHNKKTVCAMAFVMFAVLVALGLWQMQRLAWKEDLIAKIETRRAMPAVPLPDKIENPQEWEYRRVRVTGAFFREPRFLIRPRMHHGKVGYHLVMPLRIKFGGVIYVNRGWISDAELASLNTSGRYSKMEGVLRVPVKGTFTPENDPVNDFWYWPDLDAMGEKAGKKSDYPMILTLLPAAEGVYPTGYEVTSHLRNNHRLYAAFWFSMALILAIIFVIYQKKQENA